MGSKMLPRSYAAETWLLFVREEDETSALVFTALMTQKKQDVESNVIAELKVDAKALREHSEELGLEMHAEQFRSLLLNALDQRFSVDLTVEGDGQGTEVMLSLTYKFSPTISRRGLFQLPIMATLVPPSVVRLLSSIHAMPPLPMLTEQQKRQKVEKKALAGAGAAGKKMDTTGSQEGSEAAAASRGSENGAPPTMANPMLLKRRHVPTGTMRRKGPRGAKLAKK